MYVRFDVGTDVAMLGAWDASRGAQIATKAEWKQWSDLLEADAEAGQIFFMKTGGDGGGPVDVYIDQPVPTGVLEDLTRVEGEFLLSLPSGDLIVDGAEYYRTAKGAPKANQPARVRPGDYALRCYEWADPEAPPKSEKELERIVGHADIAFYDRMNHMGCGLGIAMLLLFPLWWYLWGFPIALPLTVVSFVGSFHVHRWIKKRNKRYQRLLQIIPTYRLDRADPAFVLELRYVSDRAGLKGGSVSA